MSHAYQQEAHTDINVDADYSPKSQFSTVNSCSNSPIKELLSPYSLQLVGCWMCVWNLAVVLPCSKLHHWYLSYTCGPNTRMRRSGTVPKTLAAWRSHEQTCTEEALAERDVVFRLHYSFQYVMLDLLYMAPVQPQL